MIGAHRDQMQRFLVAELMKVQDMYLSRGLEIRLERWPDWDGFIVLGRVPETEVKEFKVLFHDSPHFIYEEIEKLVDEIRDWLGDPRGVPDASAVAFLPPGTE